MQCQCQSFVTSKPDASNAGYLKDPFLVENIGDTDAEKSQTMDSGSEEVSASALAASQAEVWVLKKNISEMRISIENLEHVIRTMTTKQYELMREVHELKRQNFELREERRLQQDYQTVERTAMINELYEIKLVLGTRSKVLEDTEKKNTELTDALKDANQKIYTLGMKYLHLKSKSKAAANQGYAGSEAHLSLGLSSNLDDSDSVSIYSRESSE